MKLHFNKTGMMEILRLLYIEVYLAASQFLLSWPIFCCASLFADVEISFPSPTTFWFWISQLQIYWQVRVNHYYSNKSYPPVVQWLERPNKYWEGREFDSHLGLGIFSELSGLSILLPPNWILLTTCLFLLKHIAKHFTALAQFWVKLIL